MDIDSGNLEDRVKEVDTLPVSVSTHTYSLSLRVDPTESWAREGDDTHLCFVEKCLRQQGGGRDYGSGSSTHPLPFDLLPQSQSGYAPRSFSSGEALKGGTFPPGSEGDYRFRPVVGEPP